MQMPPSLRKLMLTTHVTASVGWAGALGVFLAHAVVSVSSADTQLVRAACIAMGLSAWLVILPLSLVSLVSGIVQALGTAFGLIRHYWVVFKLVLTVAATAVLLLKLAPISYLAEAASQAGSLDPSSMGVRMSLLVHAVGGLAFLLVATVLAIYKPGGVTKFGRRAQPQGEGILSAAVGSAAVPRWVKFSAAATVVVFLLLLSMALFGIHSPRVHG